MVSFSTDQEPEMPSSAEAEEEMASTQELPALSKLNIDRLNLPHTDDSNTSENHETSALGRNAVDRNVDTPVPKDVTRQNTVAPAADQHNFINRTSVNATLCDLCRKCIGDIVTGDCFVEATSKRSSRWTFEQTPINFWADELSFRFYEDIKSVEVSALRGCKLCLMISRGAWQCGSQRMFISVTGLPEGMNVLNTIKDTTRELWMIHSWMRGLDTIQGFLPFVQNVDRQATDSNQQEWYCQNTGSDKVMDTIRTWMSECLETHIPCARKTRSSLPTRVIDVGQADDSHNPYLLESKGGVAPYLALSYCWGTGKSFVSTRDSISRRKEGFMMAELPETLRDAILVTRRLGVRYLWIDALCIIQDDANDWNLESSNMRAIYRNALFVISALDASHSDPGMFYDRNALLASSDDTSATSDGLYVREDERYKGHSIEPYRMHWAIEPGLFKNASRPQHYCTSPGRHCVGSAEPAVCSRREKGETITL